jgi:hypothetical protein
MEPPAGGGSVALPNEQIKILVDARLGPDRLMSPELIIAMGRRTKMPGSSMTGEIIELSLRHQPPEETEPHKCLIGEAMEGVATLPACEDAVEAAWAVVEPILESPTPVPSLPSGRRGSDGGRPHRGAPRWLAQPGADR